VTDIPKVLLSYKVPGPVRHRSCYANGHNARLVQESPNYRLCLSSTAAAMTRLVDVSVDSTYRDVAGLVEPGSVMLRSGRVRMKRARKEDRWATTTEPVPNAATTNPEMRPRTGPPGPP
jgi:hypothetical protein